MSSESDTARLQAIIRGKDWPTALVAVCGQFPETAVFSTSFGLEDQAILHAIAQAGMAVRVVTLDTGRLFEETHTLHAETRKRYHLPIEVFFPEPAALQALIAERGPNGFYESTENRRACCHVRKVEPLRLALAGSELWITGIRREQSQERAQLAPIEWDKQHGLLKYHPLLDVSETELRRYISLHDVPYNPLHDKGYPSIGCAPCTRAVAPGEPARRGRWWWEDDAKKECGLHVQDGRLVRRKESDS
jgi:phosphoadenosine phosphosulfate reductase